MTRIYSISVSGLASAPVNTVAPVVSGTATVGQTLSCTTGTWTGSPTPTYTYQWRRDGSNIAAATASTYLLVQADATHSIDCVVTATNTSGAVPATSNALSPIYDAEAAAYIPRASITNATLKTLVNDFIVGAKSDFSATALSDFADSIQLVANQVAAGTVIDMTTNHYDGSLVNSPTFTQFREVANAGSTDYMNDGFNPSTMGVRYQRDSKTYGFYLRTNPGNSQPIIGLIGAAGYQSLAYIDGGDGNDYLRDAIGGGAIFSSSGRLTGHFALSRTASNLTTGYHNGVSRGTGADASVALANLQGHLHGVNNNGAGHVACANGTGFSLAYKLRGTTGPEMAAFHARVNTLLTGVFAL